MAKQDPHPPSWFTTDGCSGVLDFTWVTDKIREACDIHDVDHYWGGPTPEMKLKADHTFYKNLRHAGRLGRILAPIRLKGVRRLTWNTPPKRGSLAGPPERRYDTMWEALKHGQTRVEAWNWPGPGRGKHANMPAQDHLLPEQMSLVSAVKAAREVA